MVNPLATLNLFLVFATIISTFSGFPMYSCKDLTEIEVKIYCSSSLSDALQLICGGKFYSLSNKYPDTMGSSSSTPQLYKESALLSKLIPEDFFQPLANGSIHECCRRPCGYSELKLYCATD